MSDLPAWLVVPSATLALLGRGREELWVPEGTEGTPNFHWLKTHCLGSRSSPPLRPAVWKCSLREDHTCLEWGFVQQLWHWLLLFDKDREDKVVLGLYIDTWGCQSACLAPCPCMPLATSPSRASIWLLPLPLTLSPHLLSLFAPASRL